MGLCLGIFLLCLLGFFYWDFFIWTCYWDFLIWTFYGKIFIGTFYEYFFIGTFVAFILDLLSVLLLGLFSSMGFFPLLIVSIFERLFFLRPSKYPNLLLSHQGRCWRLLDILQISAELFCRIDILLNFFSNTPRKRLQGLERTFYSHLVASTQLPFWGKITEIL